MKTSQTRNFVIFGDWIIEMKDKLIDKNQYHKKIRCGEEEVLESTLD